MTVRRRRRDGCGDADDIRCGDGRVACFDDDSVPFETRLTARHERIRGWTGNGRGDGRADGAEAAATAAADDDRRAPERQGGDRQFTRNLLRGRTTSKMQGMFRLV